MKVIAIITAACFAVLAVVGPWAFAESKQPEIPVTVQSLNGDDIQGVVSIDDLKSSLSDIARDGEVVFRGGLIPATDFLRERGAHPLDVDVQGKITMPGQETESAFSYVFEDHLILHRGKWSVEVIGPKNFEPDVGER